MSADPDRLLNEAIRCLEADDEAGVEAAASQVLASLVSSDPRTARAISIRGAGRMLSNPQRGLKDMGEAAELAPNDADVQRAYGDALLGARLYKEAESPLGRAVQLSNGHPDIVAQYCECLVDLKKPRQALQIIDRVLKANRATPAILRAYSKALHQNGDIYAARDVLSHLYGEAGPQREDDRTQLARIELALREYDAAKKLLDACLKDNPNSLTARLISVTLADWTDDKEAQAEHIHVLKRDWSNEPDAMALIVDHSDELTDAQLADAEALAARTEGSLDDGRISLAYSLGQYFDRRKDHERAWKQASAANDLFARHFGFEQNADVRATQLRVMRKRLEVALRLFEETRDTPVQKVEYDYIYLVGSPRSGSTLLQSVLAAPEGVSSIGERTSLYPYLAFATERNAPTQEFIQLAQQLGQAEAAGLKRMGITGPLLIEKTPHHLYVAGLLSRVNPGARFVNVLRDAGEVGLSMFLRPFSAHFPEATSLDSLADMLELRLDVANAWRDAGLDISAQSFDAFRERPEEQGEALFNRLGLNWSSDYLDPEKRPEAVTTFSAQQVRKKIYANARPHWRDYEAFAPEAFARLAEITTAQDKLLEDWAAG
ncbi:MAG: hypothetical protein CMK07_03350 [Ponticaulis sp.]|nr:hypothetical protein [Ponticaulis sp.]